MSRPYKSAMKVLVMEETQEMGVETADNDEVTHKNKTISKQVGGYLISQMGAL